MKNKSLNAFVFVALIVSSCIPKLNKEEKTAHDLKPVEINNDFSLSVPAYMTKATTLNDAASLQFQNIFKESYVIVIDEDKQNFIDTFMESGSYDTARSVVANYADIQIQSTISAMEVTNQSEVTEFEINGLKAASSQIDGKVEGVDVPISYFLTLVEGEDKMYMIMAWTLQEKKETHRETFEKMAKTFKLI